MLFYIVEGISSEQSSTIRMQPSEMLPKFHLCGGPAAMELSR